MKMRARFLMLASGVLSLLSSIVFADGAKCAALAHQSFGTEVKIDSATLVAATPAAPEHCDVRGVILPEAKFAVKLPSNWNHRFYMVGGGGFAGNDSSNNDDDEQTEEDEEDKEDETIEILSAGSISTHPHKNE